MSTPFATMDDLVAPIIADWTIRDLLEWLADDARAHDEALREPLLLIEAALTGSPWTREPSTIVLTRSIASTVQTSPRLRNMRIDDLLDARIARPAPEPTAERPVTRFARVPVPQVV